MDSIATRIWLLIYNGNIQNTNQHIHDFTRKYADLIFKHPTVEVEPVTGNGLKQTGQAAGNSAAGLDNFSPGDFKYLSDLTYEWLAYLVKHHRRRSCVAQ